MGKGKSHGHRSAKRKDLGDPSGESSSESSGCDGCDMEDKTAVAARAAEDVMEELREERERYDAGDDDSTYFYLFLPGGKWTEEHKGKVNDCAACLVRNFAASFCIRYKFQKKYSFMFSKYPPGKDKALALARAWVHKGNYYFQKWFDLGACDVKYIFTQDDKNGYVETAEFLDFALALELDDPAFDKLVLIRNWVPAY